MFIPFTPPRRRRLPRKRPHRRRKYRKRKESQIIEIIQRVTTASSSQLACSGNYVVWRERVSSAGVSYRDCVAHLRQYECYMGTDAQSLLFRHSTLSSDLSYEMRVVAGNLTTIEHVLEVAHYGGWYQKTDSPRRCSTDGVNLLYLVPAWVTLMTLARLHLDGVVILDTLFQEVPTNFSYVAWARSHLPDGHGGWLNTVHSQSLKSHIPRKYGVVLAFPCFPASLPRVPCE